MANPSRRSPYGWVEVVADEVGCARIPLPGKQACVNAATPCVATWLGRSQESGEGRAPLIPRDVDCLTSSEIAFKFKADITYVTVR